MSNPWDDDQFEDVVIDEARPVESGGWDLRFVGGMGFYLSAEYGATPKAGGLVRLYGRGFGYPVRGLALNGHVLYYETEQQYRDRSMANQLAREVEQKAQADVNKPEADARVAALPDCFRQRIERFRRNNPDFYWKFERYEMSACVDAVRIADALRDKPDPIEALNDFHALPWERQKAAVPDLDDGHSGNTFGMACRLAHHYLTDPRLVFAEHAAISALVGCEDAGCLPATDTEMTAAGYEPWTDGET
jgi:hypothetical protein